MNGVAGNMERVNVSTTVNVLAVLLGSLVMCASASQVCAQGTWDVELFSQRAQDAVDYSEQAQTADGPDRDALLTQSAEAYRDCIRLLDGFLASDEGHNENVRNQARTQLLIIYHNLVKQLIDLDRCEDAQVYHQAALEEIAREATTEEAAEPVLELDSDIASCFERVEPEAVVVVAEQGPEVPETSEVPQVEATESNGRDITQWTLVGTGAALILGGLITDRVLAGDADEFDQLQAACAIGPCDSDRALELQSSLDTGKVVVGALVGFGIASALVGTILVLTDHDTAPPTQVTAAPLLARDVIGLELGATF